MSCTFEESKMFVKLFLQMGFFVDLPTLESCAKRKVVFACVTQGTRPKYTAHLYVCMGNEKMESEGRIANLYLEVLRGVKLVLFQYQLVITVLVPVSEP